MPGDTTPHPYPVRVSLVLAEADYWRLRRLCTHYTAALGYPLAQAQLLRALLRLTASEPVPAVRLAAVVGRRRRTRQ